MKGNIQEFIVTNRILSIMQSILLILGFLGVLRFLYGCAGSHDNPVIGWYILFGGSFLLIFLAVIAILLVPVSIANLIISITIIRLSGKNALAIVTLVFSGTLLSLLVIPVLICILL